MAQSDNRKKLSRKIAGKSRRPDGSAQVEQLEPRKLLTATWTALTNAAPSGIEAMVLLPNGDVMGQNYGNAGWYLLTPSSTGSYINGTWSRLNNAPDSRTYYSTQVLDNGSVYIAGGEYGTGGATGAVYNPLTNKWTAIPTGVGSYLDADSELLANGDVLEAPVYPASSGQTYLYNPTSNTWTTGPKLYRGSDADEQNWVKLADGSILAPDGRYTSERYIPATNTWINDATDAIAQTDSEGEFGTGVLLANGDAFYVGTGNTTEIYTPTGTVSPGTWTAGPTLPSSLGQDDAPEAVLPDGNVLFSVGPADSYSGPTSFYIYNPTTNSVALSPGAPTETDPPYVNRFLDLPDGTVLMSVDGATLYDYNDGGTTLTAPTPTISSIAHNTDGSYLLSGTQLNGNSEGAYYGDDAQMNSNYPIVRLTGSTGTVYFARSYNWSSTGVDTGSTPETTDFALPLGLPAGTYTVNVMVNGFISAGSALTTPAVVGDAAPTVATAAAATPSPATGVSTALSVLGADDAGESNLTYTWQNTSAPSSSSTASFSVNGTNASKSTTATFQQSGTYKFIVTITDSSGLSTTSSVTVVVNQTLTNVTVTPGSPNLTSGQTQQLTATGYDQFGNSMSTQPTFTWTLTSGSGTLSSTGLYTTPSTGTLAVVTATTGSFSATDNMYVVSAPWVSADIGSPGVAGNAFNSGGTFNVSGSGLDVYNTEDHFHYVYQTLGGNGEITARVASEPNPITAWEKAGVMIRATLDESSQQADISVTPGNGIAFQYRQTAGGSSGNVNGGSETAPYWVKLVRSGNTFTGYYSANGTTWTQEGSTTVAMTGTVYIGLFITSQSNTAASTVTFDNVSLTDAAPDSLTVTAGGSASTNVLTNDTGPSGSTLSVTAVTQPTKGTVTFNASGGVTYTANATAIGTDTFTYTLSDGLGDTATGLVTVNILGLQAYYHFNEDTGTTSADATGDGYTATLSGATWGPGVDGSYGLALSGSGQYASIPALNLNSNTVTLSGWIKTSAAQVTSAGIVFERDGSNGNGLDFYNSTTLGYTWGTNASTYSFNSGLKPTVGTWTFVALVITASNATIYMEPQGGALTSAVQTLSLPAEAFSSVTGIGEDPTYTSRDFTGAMDEVRIYNVALTLSQITAIASLNPTVATAATASPSPVTGTTTGLSVLGADYNGESVLKYTWAATTLPSGATAPTFSVNGTNGAKSTTATFTKAGTYTFTVTIADAAGLSTTSIVSVTVNQTLTSIAVTPTPAALASDATQQFTSTGKDQFGVAMTTQPTVTWSSTGSGSISTTGLYTASYTSGTATVTATSGSIASSASVTITNAAPTVATAAAVSPSPVTSTTANLSVLGTDDAGEGNLTYTWATSGAPPAAVGFSTNSTNAAKATIATFTTAGSYTFQVTITDAGGLSVASSVTVVVNQTLTSALVSPTPVNLAENGSQAFTATGYDQFGNALASQPAFTWSKTSGIGSINSAGVYTAPVATGSAVIVASSGSVSASASITVSNTAPTIATAASAAPSPVTGTTTALSVLGADDGGESNLTYTWTTTAIPNGATAPTYNINATNAAKNNTATFAQAGTYTFTVTVADGQGGTTTSSVNVTVNQTLTTIAVTPASVNVAEDGTQQFTAVGYDQFANTMSIQPTVTWAKTAGVGSIDSTGLYTAPATSGTATITATGGSITGTADVTVQYNGPSIATAASAQPPPATGTGVILSVLGADPNGESNLTYTWAITAGPSTPTYSVNGTNAAKNTTATLTKAGSYTFMVTVSDGQGGTAVSSVNVTVNPTLTSVSLSNTAVAAGGTTQATAIDQFGNPISGSPTWSATGGTITTTGLFTAGTTGGSYSITASLGTTVSTSVSVVPTTYSGSTGNDTYAIRLSPTDSTMEQIFVNTAETGSPTYTIPISQLSKLTFTPSGDGSVTLDFANGNPLPANGVNYAGGDSLFIEGAASGGMVFGIGSTQITDTAAASSPVTYSGLATVEFDLAGGSNTLTQSSQLNLPVTYNAGPGNNTLNVNGGAYTINGDPALTSGSLTVNDNAAVIFTAAPEGGGYATRNLAALNIGSSATATITHSTTTADRIVLETNQLSVASGGRLDIGDNAMIVHAGNANAITNLIKTGLGGSNGIISSAAQTDTTHLTTIGIISNNNSGGTYTTAFDNQTVSSSDVLVRYTYLGDLNLDGKVDGSDYSRIDSAVLTGATGWFNGDVNYDGSINGSDYTLIDNAFNTQGSLLPVASPPPAAAPNPTAYYKFNDGVTTTATDSSGDGYTASIHNATVSNGVDGTAGLTFNGTSSYVSVPALDVSTNTVTLSGWIETSGVQTDGAGLIFERSSTSGEGLTIGSGNRLGYSWGASGSTYNFNSDLTVPAGEWTFVALVVTPGNATLYMEPQGGELVSATNSVANPAEPLSGPIDIGQDSAGGRFFKGSMDEVRIYESSLSLTDILTVADLDPIVVTAASSTPSADVAYQTALQVSAISQAGSSNLKYTWSVTSAPAGATVAFSANGNASAYYTDATGDLPGTYNFLVTISDPAGLSTTSSVSETFDVNPFDIAEINYPPATPGKGIQAWQLGNFVVNSRTPDDFNSNDNAADRWVLIFDSLTIVGPYSQLDLGNNDMIIHSTGAAVAKQTLATITSYVNSGYGQGGASNWTYGGIVSTLAADAGLGRSAISVMLNMDSSGKAIYSTFDGQKVSATDVLVKYNG